MKMWDIATINQGGRGLVSFVGTMNIDYPYIFGISYSYMYFKQVEIVNFCWTPNYIIIPGKS